MKNTWLLRLCKTAGSEPVDWIDAADNIKPTLIQNRPGSLGFSIDMGEKISGSIEQHRSEIQLVREWTIGNDVNREVHWSGPVWTYEEDFGNGILTVGTLGWMQDYYRRIIRGAYTDLVGAVIPSQEQAYPAQAGDAITYSLLAKANAQKDMNGTVRPTRVSQGTAFITDPAYTAFPSFVSSIQRGNIIGQKMQELSDIENGFDMNVDPVTRKLNLYYPRKASIKSNLHLAYNWGPENMDDVKRTYDAVRQTNRLGTYGRTSGTSPAIVEDRVSMDYWGVMLEEEMAIDTDSPSVLLGYAGAEVAIRGNPLITDSIVVSSDDLESVPQYVEDFIVGDIGLYSARRGYRTLHNQPVRIFGIGATISNGEMTVDDFQITSSGTT